MRRPTRYLYPELALVALGAALVQGCSAMSETRRGSGLGPSLESRSKSPIAMPDKRAKETVATGPASWYGPGFNGKKTASGDIFDDGKMTAAHKTMPLGTKAKVTNLSNGKTVHVEINDRGPYVEGRILDLSQAAARALGMIERGVAQVRIEPLDDSEVAIESRK